MRRFAVVVVLVAAIVIAIDVLGDLTQTRPDSVSADEVSEFVVSVDEDRFGGGRDAAANALWAVCASQTASRLAADGRLEPLGDGRYRAVLHPAVGPSDERQLVGCLEDLTVDRVYADVKSVRTLPASAFAQAAAD
jgi:hypothetical protein